MPFQRARGYSENNFNLSAFRRNRLLAAAAVALVCSAATAAAQTTAPGSAATGSAQARGAARTFDIPAQPLTNAIGAFSRQSGLQVTLASATARGITANAVKGSFTPEQALAQLLRGTGVSFRLTGNNAAVIGQSPASAAPGAADDGTIQLDTVTVATEVGGAGPGYQGAPDWIYDTPAAISFISRSAMQETVPRSSSDLFDGMSGVNVAGTPQNPGISVNVRGLQDQGRVTMTIDGARQNFAQSGHGSTAFAYVDPLLLRSVEVEKSTATGVGAAGSHGSVVNFRTLAADDLIKPGKSYGGELDVTTGTNEYDFYGLAAVAGRLGKVDGTFAISHKELGAYSIGTNGTLSPSVSAQYTLDQDAIYTGGNTWSGLAKLGWDITDDQRLELSFVMFDTEFTTSTYNNDYVNTNHVQNLTGTATYTYQPDNPLFDLKAQIWANRTENQQYRTARTTYGAFDVDYALDTYGANIANTSTFKVPLGTLALHYGAEGFLDKTSTGSTNYDAADADENWWYTGTNPNGKRWMVSPFAKATFTHGNWLEVSGGGRYDYYKLTGSSTVNAGYETVVITPRTCILYSRGRCVGYSTAVTQQVQLTEDISADQSGGHFSPEATLAVTPLAGLQVYGKYTGGFRPPSIGETLIGGEHIGGLFNYLPNPDLKPETSQNWEIGVNLKYDSVLRSGDTFRMKANYFNRSIENFIALGSAGGIFAGTTTTISGYQAVNLLGTSTLKGVEMEGNYDAGDYYVGASYTYIDANYSDTYVATFGTSTPSTGDDIYYIAVAPKQKFAMDAGLRQFDRRWVIGGKVTHVEPSDQLGINAAAYEPQIYTVWDVYSSYKFTDQAMVRFAVTNLTNVAYVDALNAAAFPAPGRTATVSLNLKF